MHYLKEIYEGRLDSDHARRKFIRYSKGEFVGPKVNLAVKGKTLKLKTSFHCVDEVLKLAAERVGDKKVHVKGKIIWNESLDSRFESVGASYSKLTKSMGLYKYVLDNEVNLKSFLEAFWDYKLLLSFNTEEVKVKSKSDFPKPHKEIVSDFCKADFPLDMKERVLDLFAFDVEEDNIKTFNVRHDIIVDEVVMPQNITDYKKAREEAKRVGKIKRYVSLNGGDEVENNLDFEI